MQRRPSVGLFMIVKNEAAVIERCLASVRDWIDHWVVVDTGSEDDTRERVQRSLQGVPGALYERPWVDFAHNRNQALELARPATDYLFTLDADEQLHCPPGWTWPALSADGYFVEMQFAELHYQRLCLVRSAHPWAYHGVLHEVLVSAAGAVQHTLAGPHVQVRAEGARSHNPRKFLDDAQVLERALQSEPDHPRHVFYLAQSYRDAGMPQRALEVYRQRVKLAGFDEERWFAQLQVALLSESCGAPISEVVWECLQAWNLRPTRAEPLVLLARIHRQRQEWPLAAMYAERAALTVRPPDLLFVDESVYVWRALDEWSIAAWYVGRHADGRAALQRLWQEQMFPEYERARIQANLGFYDLPA